MHSTPSPARDDQAPGATDQPPPGTATGAFPDDHAAHDPDRVAFRMARSGEVVTYGALVDRSRRIARHLRERGLVHGDAIALLMHNEPAFLEVAWGAQRSGLRYTAVSSRLTGPEVAYILQDSGARVLFVSPGCLPVARDALTALTEEFPQAPVPELVVTGGPAEGVEDLDRLLEPVPANPPLDDEVEGIDLLYSSGTTGRPKGVEDVLPLNPLGTPPGIAAMLRSTYGFDRDTVYLSPAPLYHSAPLRFNMTVHRAGGQCIVMERFDALEALELIERHRVTHAVMVPTMFVRMLKLPEEQRRRFDVSSLQVVIHAAAPCPADVKRAMIEWFGPVVHEFYSATENNLFTAITSEEALERPGSVGRAKLGIAHILDDEGRELPPGEIGTIWAEDGPRFTYRNDPEKTAASRNERGWTTVGDVGYLDEDGYLYMSDRRADLVLSGGVNIYPQEAESALITHPKVADVAVFGVPHDELGQEVKAVVQVAEGATPGPELAEELLAFVQGRLAKFKCPRSIDFADELPRHPTGKLYKRLLRDRYLAAHERGTTPDLRF
ncbi:acyl-CoA synthetase [Patulibacter brassicae]|uniref:Acyl-CoA synthetase n=1 Tax=Patulibacter brassicae TaxID=1705717 RepID=A0ABU4VPB9_9ACTN|nr:acyl-CoA synthetase [Patulibacter brassicae]MDX8152703.1 acyl-CoA synthetase [Patulibacter brassicae]